MKNKFNKTKKKTQKRFDVQTRVLKRERQTRINFKKGTRKEKTLRQIKTDNNRKPFRNKFLFLKKNNITIK